jgi:hypothetical protein
MVTRLVFPLELQAIPHSMALVFLGSGAGLRWGSLNRDGPVPHGQGSQVHIHILCPGLFCNRYHPGVCQMIHPVDTILALVLLSVLFLSAQADCRA